MKHSEIIVTLGGVAEIEKFLNLPKGRAAHWPRRGIPSKYHWELSSMPCPKGSGRKSFHVRDFSEAEPETARDEPDEAEQPTEGVAA